MAQRRGRLDQHLHRERRRHLPLGQHGLERAAGHELHDEEVEPVGAFDGVDRDDVRVVEPGGGLRLLLEPRDDLGVARELRRQHLDRHLALEREVVGEEDGAHAARAEQPLDHVASVEQPRQPLLELGGRVAMAHLARGAARDVHAARDAEARVVRQRGLAGAALHHRSTFVIQRPRSRE